MGYSIALRCRTKVLKQQMIAFMKKHYRNTEKLCDESVYSILTDDLSYDHAKTGLGFDYSPCSDIEHHYIFTILKWMALKIGRKKHFKKYGTVPYYVYDGIEVCPILIGKGRMGWLPVNKLGFKSFGSGFNEGQKKAREELNEITIKEADKIIHNELKRLNTLWENL